MSTFRGMGGGGARYRTHNSLHLKNPFEEERPTKRAAGSIFWGFLVGSAALLGVAVYLLFFADWMRITDIQVSGNLLLTNADIIENTRKYIEKKDTWVSPYHRFVLDKRAVGEMLMKNMPVADVTLKSSFGGVLKVQVVERPPTALVYFENDTAVLLDEQGSILIAKLPPEPEEVIVVSTVSSSSTPAITASGSEPSSVVECIFCDANSGIVPIYYNGPQPKNISIGTHPIPQADLDILQSALRGLSITGVRPLKGTFTPLDREKLVVTVTEGFDIYLDTTRPLEPQLTQFNTFIKKKFSKPPYKLQYVDVRFMNRVFYK